MNQGQPSEPTPAGTVFIQNIDTSGGGQVNAVLGGDQYNYIYRGRPPYRVEPFDPAAGPRLPPDESRRVPSRLLAARYRVVPFFPRPELAGLESWREDPSPGLSVRLLHAEGGAGKTRLAAQFGLSSARAGWTVAIALHRSEVASAGGSDQSLLVRAPGLVIVVDYADRWPLADLMTLVRQHRDAARDRLRILLLGRPAGSWWQGVTHQLAKLDIFDADAVPLTELPDDPDVRTGMYASARDSFAGIFELASPAQIPVPANLTDHLFALTLTVHMRALVDVDAVVRGVDPTSIGGPAQLSSYLLDREHDYWRSAHDLGRGPVGTAPQTLGRAVYVATLTGAAEQPAARAALGRAGVAGTSRARDTVLADHARCYPPESPGLLLEPLRPDRLGEDFLALTLPGREAEFGYYDTDPWASSAASLLLRPEGSQVPPHARPALTALVETARRWPHVASGVLDPLLRDSPALALAGGGVTLGRLADLTGIDLDVLEGIEAQLPELPDLELDLGIAALVQRLTTHRLTTTDDLGIIAELHAKLAWRYGSAGLTAEALAPAATSVGHYRRLVSGGSREHRPGLAAALDNLGIIRTRLGQWQEALDLALEATAIRRELAEADSATFLPELAISLNNLSNRYWNLGRYRDGLAPARQARDLYERLAGSEPASYLPDLAMVQGNLSNFLADLGQRQEALNLAEQSLATYRRLASSVPTTYLPDLASALNCVSNLRGDAGRRTEALEPAKEAESIFRRLAQANPASFLPSLAMAVNNLGISLGELGRPEEALPAAQEATDLYRQLAAASPAAYLPDLAMALNNLSIRLGALDRADESLDPALEAIRLYRELASARPEAYRRNVAAATLNASMRYSEAGQSSQALRLIEEAARVFAELAEADPEVYLPEFGVALGNLGAELAGAGRFKESLAATTRSVSIFRGLAGDDPASHLADLARALDGFAIVRELGDIEPAEAAAAARESASIRETLAGAARP